MYETHGAGAFFPFSLTRTGRCSPASGWLCAGVVVRFSALAIASVAVLAVTGVYRALAELSSLSDLVDTGYGRALVVKLVLFAALLAVGAYNRLVLHARLERAALGLRSDDGGASHRLRASIAAELALGAALRSR